MEALRHKIESLWQDGKLTNGSRHELRILLQQAEKEQTKLQNTINAIVGMIFHWEGDIQLTIDAYRNDENFAWESSLLLVMADMRKRVRHIVKPMIEGRYTKEQAGEWLNDSNPELTTLREAVKRFFEAERLYYECMCDSVDTTYCSHEKEFGAAGKALRKAVGV